MSKNCVLGLQWNMKIKSKVEKKKQKTRNTDKLRKQQQQQQHPEWERKIQNLNKRRKDREK